VTESHASKPEGCREPLKRKRSVASTHCGFHFSQCAPLRKQRMAPPAHRGIWVLAFQEVVTPLLWTAKLGFLHHRRLRSESSPGFKQAFLLQVQVYDT
jgi:hypothetical protein